MDYLPGTMILILQLASTLFMTGLIWLIQLVHYPLFAHVGRAEFPLYEALHTRKITLIVMPMMLVELGSALVLVASPPPGFSRLLPSIGLTLLAAVWITTAVWSVPAHGALSGGFQDGPHATLVATNWIRTLAWTARSGVLLWMLAAVIAR